MIKTSGTESLFTSSDSILQNDSNEIKNVVWGWKTRTEEIEII